MVEDICAIIHRVFDEPVPKDAPCAQDWREERLLSEIRKFFYETDED